MTDLPSITSGSVNDEGTFRSLFSFSRNVCKEAEGGLSLALEILGRLIFSMAPCWTLRGGEKEGVVSIAADSK